MSAGEFKEISNQIAMVFPKEDKVSQHNKARTSPPLKITRTSKPLVFNAIFEVRNSSTRFYLVGYTPRIEA